MTWFNPPPLSVTLHVLPLNSRFSSINEYLLYYNGEYVGFLSIREIYAQRYPTLQYEYTVTTANGKTKSKRTETITLYDGLRALFMLEYDVPISAGRTSVVFVTPTVEETHILAPHMTHRRKKGLV